LSHIVLSENDVGTRSAEIKIVQSCFPNYIGTAALGSPPKLGNADHRPVEYPCAMDKKEIESPKLTANFLIWISAFMLLLFALLAHFVWKVF
jgi:hypothetical protein